MAYRRSLLKYAEKYGVGRASRKYDKSRSYIYFWKQHWDGTAASLATDRGTALPQDRVRAAGRRQSRLRPAGNAVALMPFYR